MTQSSGSSIDLDWAIQQLDPNAQQVIIRAAQTWARDKQNASPGAVAPMDAGREGDEQYPAPVDTIKLIDTTTTETETVYDIEVSIAGTLDPISVRIANDGSVGVQRAE